MHRRPDAVAAAVNPTARDSYQRQPDLNEPLNLMLAATLGNIPTLCQQFKSLHQEIEREVRKFPNRLVSVTGPCRQLMPGVTPHIQDIHRFPDRFTLAKFGQLFQHDSESRPFQAEETPVGTSGNAYLPYHLIAAASWVWVHSAEYVRY